MSKGNREKPAVDSADQQEKLEQNSAKCSIRGAGRSTCLKMRTWAGKMDAKVKQDKNRESIPWIGNLEELGSSDKDRSKAGVGLRSAWLRGRVTPWAALKKFCSNEGKSVGGRGG